MSGGVVVGGNVRVGGNVKMGSQTQDEGIDIYDEAMVVRALLKAIIQVSDSSFSEKAIQALTEMELKDDIKQSAIAFINNAK